MARPIFSATVDSARPAARRRRARSLRATRAQTRSIRARIGSRPVQASHRASHKWTRIRAVATLPRSSLGRDFV